MKRLAWGRNVSANFRARVYEMTKNLGWPESHASWIMACMAFETAETFSPSIRNGAGSGAVGLIQFMPSTAQYLGTDVLELASMTSVQQLEYVARYFRPYAAKIKTLSDMYMAILMPRYIGAPDETPIIRPGVAYRQNAKLDLNADGQITKDEAAVHVRRKLIKGWAPELAIIEGPSDKAVAWRWSEDNGKTWFDWTTDFSGFAKAAEKNYLIEEAFPGQDEDAAG